MKHTCMTGIHTYMHIHPEKERGRQRARKKHIPLQKTLTIPFIQRG